MHIIFGTRGDKHRVDEFIQELDAKWLHWFKDKKTNKDNYINVSVRPFQLWEVVFPEQHKDVMLTTLFDYNGTSGDDVKRNGFPKHQSVYSKLTFPIRKALRLDPIPKKWNNKEKILLSEDAVQRIAIGTKKDSFHEGVEQI